MKNRKLKTALGLVLSVVLIFTAVVPAFALGNKCNCGKTPVLSVWGFNSVPLYDGNGKQVFSPSQKDIAKTVLKVLPSVTAYLRDKNVDNLLNGLLPAVNELFAPIKCGPDGKPLDSTVHINGFDPADISSFRYNEGDNAFDDGLVKAVGEDHVYRFTYDWRKSPFEIARDLKTVVEKIKDETGHNKIAINGQSMGAAVVQTYISMYGTTDFETVAMFSGAFTGLEMMGHLFTGNIQIDADGVTNMIVQAIRGSGEYNSLLKHIPVIAAFLQQLDPVIAQGKDRLYKEFVIPTFGYIPSVWAFVPADYFEDAYDYMLKDASVGLKAEILRYYTTVLTPMEMRVKSMAASPFVNYFCVSHYNRVMSPVTPAGNWDSDGVIETAHTSGYATVAPFGETLGDGYEQERACHKNHVSPDNRIDASTCWAPENTWFIKNADHISFNNATNNFFVWLMTADRQYDVRSNPLYPQFMLYNRNTEYLTAYLYEYGDVNLDGTINLIDARLALRDCIEREELPLVNFQRADSKPDGVITKAEVRSIMAAYVNN